MPPVSVPAWRERADRLHRWLVQRSASYHPYSPRDAEMLALALVGEAGEVAQEFYKRTRDGRDNDNFRAQVRQELADVRIYLALLTEAVNGDEARNTHEKLLEVEERWKAKGYEP